MPSTDTIVIGAGHAGLAMSRCLADRGVPHVVLDRGRIGERWRTARWDGFRMLTPNWMSRLPGWSYAGPDPDGFMTAAEFADHLSGYARSFDAPVRAGTTVTRVERTADLFAVHTTDGSWHTRNVVVATGYHSHAQVPLRASGPFQVTAAAYKSPADLPDGGVLVVGASASGVQIAHDLAVAGRRVLLAVGRHTRLPRRYRDRDILWWLDRIGTLDRTIDECADPDRARAEPSLQLAGTPDPRGLDLGVLQREGVRLAGRLRSLRDDTAVFADDLAESMGAADNRLTRLLTEIDDHASGAKAGAHRPVAGVEAGTDRPPRIAVPSYPESVDLGRAGVGSVVWATGYRPRYPWLKVPVLDPAGRIRHRRGVTGVPGLYAIGLRFQYRRDSTFVDGARWDAAYLADHLVAHRPTRLEV